MSYQLEKRPDHSVRVDGHLDADVVAKERKAVVKAIARHANLPGFRRGKVPPKVVAKRFAEEIDGQLTERLARSLWNEVLAADDTIEPLTPMQVHHHHPKDDGGYHIEGEFQVRPNYDLPAVEDIELPKIDIAATDEDIDGEIDRMRDGNAAWELAEDEKARDGLLAEVSTTVTIGDGEPETSEGHILIGDEGVPAEINTAMQGAAAGDTVTAEITYPEDEGGDPSIAGKKAVFSIEIKQLNEKVLPEIDEALAQEAGCESIEELRERIASAVTHHKAGERYNQWRRHVLDVLSKDIDLELLPKAAVQQSLEEAIRHQVMQMAMAGHDIEGLDVEGLAGQLQPHARRSACDDLILDQLAKAWEIAVPEADVDTYLRREAVQQKVPPAELKARMASDGTLTNLRNAARHGATIREAIRRAGGEEEG